LYFLETTRQATAVVTRSLPLDWATGAGSTLPAVSPAAAIRTVYGNPICVDVR
jgi:hypothetical protein